MKYKYELIKQIDEFNEVEFCIYCGKKLEIVGKNKVCPDKCVKVEFMYPKDFFKEIFKEKKESEIPPMRGCQCKYPLIS